jgi:glutamate racemase
VARQVRRRLGDAGLLADAARRGGERFWTSGDPGRAHALVCRLWGPVAEVEPLPPEPARPVDATR